LTCTHKVEERAQLTEEGWPEAFADRLKLLLEDRPTSTSAQNCTLALIRVLANLSADNHQAREALKASGYRQILSKLLSGHMEWNQDVRQRIPVAIMNYYTLISDDDDDDSERRLFDKEDAEICRRLTTQLSKETDEQAINYIIMALGSLLPEGLHRDLL
jgi:hypothetical protein